MRDCHVRRLAIQAPDAAAAGRGALLVEDALRTASLPGESSRLLIVRRLHIGAIPAHVNATAVSRRIEAAFAQLPAQAIAAADPAAARAPAVYFADEIDACVQLAVLGARGQAPDAWFWPHAVTGWRSGYGPAYAVRCALGAAARQPSGADAAAHAIRRVVAELLAAGVLDAALAALEPEDGPVLLRLCGWYPPVPRARAAAPSAQPSSPVQQSAAARPDSPRLAYWAATWGASDARTLWLAAVLLAADQPVRASDSALAEQAAAWVEQLSAQSPPRTGKAAAPSPEQHGAADVGVDAAPGTPPRSRSAPPTAQASLPAGAPRLGELASSPSDAQPLPPVAQVSQPADARRSSESEPSLPVEPAPESLVWWRGLPLQPTEAGGLWFLLSVLARLGIRTWMQDHPDAAGGDLPWQVLAGLARRVETPLRDPVWSALRHGDIRGTDQSVVWWCDRVEEWCAALPGLGESGLSLAVIVRRRGWLYTTATHIDVFFDLAQADLRIRRLGLDLDPGWLPWLRRVVAFYYEAGLVEVSG